MENRNQKRDVMIYRVHASKTKKDELAPVTPDPFQNFR